MALRNLECTSVSLTNAVEDDLRNVWNWASIMGFEILKVGDQFSLREVMLKEVGEFIADGLDSVIGNNAI